MSRLSTVCAMLVFALVLQGTLLLTSPTFGQNEKKGELTEKASQVDQANLPDTEAYPRDSRNQIDLETVYEEDYGIEIPGELVESLIINLSEEKKTVAHDRLFSENALIDTSQFTGDLIRKSGMYYTESRNLVVQSELKGKSVVEDFHFLLNADDTFVVLRDIYLEGDLADLSVGRGLPFQIDNAYLENEQPDFSVVAPTLYSIMGVTSSAAGISNGKVAMSCGTIWNGHYAINDQRDKYTLTLNGNNFGNTSGTVQLGGTSVHILSWSNTRIVIDPTMNWSGGAPSCAVFKIRNAAGGLYTSGLNIVPAIRTRIYGQCTYLVAKTRLERGLQPSPTAYGSYAAINGAYVPRAGDQYQWGGGAHTGILIGVTGPVSSSGGIRTWSLTIKEQNANCSNAIRTYSAQFQTKTTGSSTTVTVYPRSSMPSMGSATLYYAYNR